MENYLVFTLFKLQIALSLQELSKPLEKKDWFSNQTEQSTTTDIKPDHATSYQPNKSIKLDNIWHLYDAEDIRKICERLGCKGKTIINV